MTENEEKPQSESEKRQLEVGDAEMAERDGQADAGETPDKEIDGDGRVLPILAVKELVLYPDMIVPLMIGRPKSLRVIEHVLVEDRVLGIVMQKDGSVEEPSAEDLHGVGCVAILEKMVRMPDDTLRILVRGVQRFLVEEWIVETPFFSARIVELVSQESDSVESEALIAMIRQLFGQIVELSSYLPGELATVALNIDEGGKLADFVASNLNFPPSERVRLLKTADVVERLKQVQILLTKELEVLKLGSKIQAEVKEVVNKSQREFILREQLKAIQKELGEADEHSAEIEDLKARISEAPLSDDAKEVAEKQIKRLKSMNPAAAEYSVTRTYLDWLLDLPWNKLTPDKLDINEASKILDEDHYGLEKIKTRILEYLAVRKLKEDMKGPILCFVGPPGVGKTSLGRSIARSMDRKFFRMSLGGMRDEAEIRGHRRTYIGALPGRILQGLKKCGSSNPVFMLDEIDKVGSDYRGDPSSALLEVLDPEQNYDFTDHYLEIPYDLSRILWLTTANLLDTVPRPLRDRMEIIELPGYTEEEKLEIALRYLIPKQLEAHGITEEHLEIGDSALRLVIEEYTREAGVRNLERNLGALCRRVAKEIVGGCQEKTTAGEPFVRDVLGPQKFFFEVKERTSRSGVATGLAWTAVGGDILFVEATMMRGSGKLVLTGKLGDVMKESAQAALSYVRTNALDFDIDPATFAEQDLHIHVPAGAIPKDGPSAGVTMFTALVSLLTGNLVRHDIAMTGEITLRGAILPVGGIKEKVLAAKRAGITRILLPKRNENDLVEISESFKEGMQFEFVREMSEILPLVLVNGKIPISSPPDPEPQPAGE